MARFKQFREESINGLSWDEGIKMINHSSFKKILDVAVYAPSGDNAQPWQFKFDDNGISLFNLPERDATLFNFRQRGSYIGHGAVVENIIIAAAMFGYIGKVQPFPGIPNCTARITLETGASRSELLYTAITDRVTNRKPYDKKPFNPNHRNAIHDSVKGYPDVKLKIAENRDELEFLARSVSLSERLIMENRLLHDSLYSMVRWSLKEEQIKPGLYIKTMEFSPPQRTLFRLLRRWSIVRTLNAIGLSRLIPKQSSQVYAASSAIGALILKHDTDQEFLSAGRAFQRLWLTATNLDLSIQPITAIPYLAQRIFAGEAQAFSPRHIQLIREAYRDISQIFGLDQKENIAMLFRIGYDGAPSARSSKLSPTIIT